jgi:hypothetical protein
MTEAELFALTAEEIWEQIVEGYISKEMFALWVANECKEAIELQNL